MILAIDLGSGSVRVALIDVDGSQHAVWAGPGLPVAARGERREIDLDSLMTSVRALLDQAARYCDERGHSVSAVTCTAVRYAFVLVTAAGRAVASWANTDRAASAVALEVRARTSPEDRRRAGGWVSPLSALARLWWASAALQIGEKLTFLPLNAWLLGQFGASPHCDVTSACDTHAFDIAQQAWLQHVPGIGWPEVVTTGAEVGRFTGGPAMLNSAPLVAGCGDSFAAVNAFTDLLPGDVVVVAGTTTPVMRVLTHDDARAVDENLATISTVVLGDRAEPAAIAERNAGRTGHVTAWICRTVGATADELEQGGAHVPRTLSLHLGPTVAGPATFGVRRPNRMLHLADPDAPLPSAEVLYGAAVRANAWATANHVSTLLRLAAKVATDQARVVVCGGQARSGLFVTSLSTALQMPVIVGPAEPSLLGVAAAAQRGFGRSIGVAVGTGLFFEPEPGDRDAQDAWSARQSELERTAGQPMQRDVPIMIAEG